ASPRAVIFVEGAKPKRRCTRRTASFGDKALGEKTKRGGVTDCATGSLFDVLGLVRPADGTPIDRRGEIERPGKKPWTIRPGYPDLVMVRRRGRKSRRGAVITIEVQVARDDDKRWMIPGYSAPWVSPLPLAALSRRQPVDAYSKILQT